MKRILLILTLAFSFTLSANTYAGPLAGLVNQANSLRMNAIYHNQCAADIERIIRQRIYTRQYVPNAWRHEAYQHRNKARQLALHANFIAKQAFNAGYVRPGYSVVNAY